jgi:deoxycytidylate deaminase
MCFDIEMGDLSLGPDRLSRQPELVFGLVGALGADLKSVASAIRRELRDVGYRVSDEPIKLSALMHRLPGTPFDTLNRNGKRAGVEAHMDAGNALRERLRNDALAMLAIHAVRAAREAEFGQPPESPANGVAFILDSLKHHAEVESLRRLYGPAFIAVGVYTPYERRLSTVQKRLREGAMHGSPGDYRADAERLIEKDFDEQNKSFGQHVSDAFALADVVVYAAGDETSSVSRFIKLLFGDWTNTPMRDEVGMTHAQIAAYQSASMARQVGAAICRSDGSLVATGSNDVPKYGGGIFDADDVKAKKTDVRDFAEFGFDTSDDQRQELLEDILRRLIEAKILTSMSEEDATAAAETMLHGRNAIMRKAKFMSTIDYIRALHAETAALSAAAQHGIAVGGCTLYVTTFPCHDCAKQIIASGIERVVYIEPYTKSLTRTFYKTQVNIDGLNASAETVKFEPFVGVAPRRYRELFAMGDARKDAAGRYMAWSKDVAAPRLAETVATSSARSAGEKAELSVFNELARHVGFGLA